MIPIVLAFVEELNQVSEQQLSPVTAPLPGSPLSVFDVCKLNIRDSSEGQPQSRESQAQALVNSKKMYLLAVGYASKIGGNGAITATAPNLVFQELIKRLVLVLDYFT